MERYKTSELNQSDPSESEHNESDKIKVEVTLPSSNKKIVQKLDRNYDGIRENTFLIKRLSEESNNSLKLVFENITATKDLFLFTQKEHEEYFRKADEYFELLKPEEKSEIKAWQNDETNIKHKIKLSLPIFFFTKYEREFSLDNATRPKSWKEFKEIFLNSDRE